MRVPRRRFLEITGAAAVAAGGCSVLRKAKPNILLIVSDRQHFDTINAFGQGHVRTPALDRLASRSITYATAYCAGPAPGASHGAILTGRMPSETGVGSIGRGIPNLGDWFQERAGYKTVRAGIWDVANDPLAGFDVLPGGLAADSGLGDATVSRACGNYLRGAAGRPFLMAVSLAGPRGIGDWLRLNRQDPGVLRYPEIAGELPALPDNFDYEPLEPRALELLRQRSEPFAGQWSDEHWRYYLWSYYRLVEAADGEIGRILEALDDSGAADETVVLFAASCGESLAHHQMAGAGTSYEESVRVPLLVSWPGHLPENQRDTGTLASGIDIVPTLCDLAGIEPPPDCRGRSLRPPVTGAREYTVAEIPPNAGRAVRSRTYKYATYAGDTVEQLFDLGADPGETHNLAPESGYGEILRDHRRMLVDWEATLTPAPGAPNLDAWWRRG